MLHMRPPDHERLWTAVACPHSRHLAAFGEEPTKQDKRGFIFSVVAGVLDVTFPVKAFPAWETSSGMICFCEFWACTGGC